MSKHVTSPTIYGIETEYSCMVTWPDEIVYEIVGGCHSFDSKLQLYQQPQTKRTKGLAMSTIAAELEDVGIWQNSQGMLSNGGRLYIDPSGPEYATPETTTAEEAAIRSFDGDEILLGVFRGLRDEGIIDGFQLNRRIVDHNRVSRGVHLNTTTKLLRDTPSPNNAAKIATLNAAKGAIFGSGGLLLNSHGETEFHHSPRLSITDYLTADSYEKRPLVRIPFKDDVPGIYRVETITSDALNFVWPLKASMVMTNALIKIIELGYADKLPELKNPITAATKTGKHGPDAKVDLMARGREKSITVVPLDIIRMVAELALTIDEKEKHLDKETSQVLPEVIEVADRMSDDMFSVANQVESVARLVAMEQKMTKDKLTLESEKMCRFDYAWDWIGGGIAETLRNRGTIGWQGSTLQLSRTPEARKRRTTPPQDTRAKIRGDAIKATKGRNASSWERLEQMSYKSTIHPLKTEQ